MTTFTVLCYSVSLDENASIHLSGCKDIKRNVAENGAATYEVEGSLQDAIDSYLDDEMKEMGWTEDTGCLKVHNCAKHSAR